VAIFRFYQTVLESGDSATYKELASRVLRCVMRP